MKNPASRILTAFAAAGMLSACSSGTQPATSSQPASPLVQRLLQLARNGNAPNAAGRGASRISPEAKKQGLLYVSDSGTNEVHVYSFPGGTSEGTLTGFDYPYGMCTDKKGDIWIANFLAHEILEYAHGGTSPIATLSDPNEYPFACSVDPTTGNLAVSNIFGTGSIAGSIAVYADAQGSPTIYSDSSIYYMEYCGYDKQGDLFMDGTPQSSGSFELAELPKGGSSIGNITLSGTIHSPGGVQWWGKYLTVGDDYYESQSTSSVDQIQVSGSTASIVGYTVLTGSAYVQGYTIAKSRDRAGKAIVVAPNLAASSNVLFYKYPAGGTATKTLTGFTNPISTAVSW
jgi:hypothetical protein